ncbi:MAG TPA: hypothetical protein VNS32_16645, partial [Flavisolibacter sp.]|nr:hypothetical protein [Flavisolibacter sp.]
EPRSGSGNNNNGGTPDGTLLVRSVGISGSDSTSTIYTYDNQKRLETVTEDGIKDGSDYHRYKKYVRDGSGRIIKTLTLAADQGFSSDTVIDKVHYANSSTMEFDYDVINYDQAGVQFSDSTVYNYSGGKMQSLTMYVRSSIISMPVSKVDFAYDGSGNVTKMTMYGTTDPTQPIQNLGYQDYTYGSVQNAQWAPSSAAQNYLINSLPNATNAAMTKLVFTNLSDPGAGGTVNFSYVSGANNKPSTEQAVTVGDPTVSNMRYYYQ